MRPEEIFEQLYLLMRYGNSITNVSESSGVSTISTPQIYTLANGMLVEIGNNVYSISNISRNGINNYSFDVNGTGITADSWQLALYYEFGRALEVGNTLKEQKDDPVNKNKRFPLMWLLTDIEKNENFDNINFEASITLGFIYLSEKNLKAKKRLEENIKPILDPLVDLFKLVINNSPGSRYFTLPFGGNININETDKFKYGSIAGNTHVFNDITDAVQLDMTLKFSKFGTCLSNSF